MPLPDLNKAVGHSFGLEVDGVQIKQIQEVSGLKMEQDVIELKQNTADGKCIIKKLPGRFKAGEATFTRGLTDDHSFEDWFKDTRSAKGVMLSRMAASSPTTIKVQPSSATSSRPAGQNRWRSVRSRQATPAYLPRSS